MPKYKLTTKTNRLRFDIQGPTKTDSVVPVTMFPGKEYDLPANNELVSGYVSSGYIEEVKGTPEKKTEKSV